MSSWASIFKKPLSAAKPAAVVAKSATTSDATDAMVASEPAASSAPSVSDAEDNLTVVKRRKVIASDTEEEEWSGNANKSVAAPAPAAPSAAVARTDGTDAGSAAAPVDLAVKRSQAPDIKAEKGSKRPSSDKGKVAAEPVKKARAVSPVKESLAGGGSSSDAEKEEAGSEVKDEERAAATAAAEPKVSKESVKKFASFFGAKTESVKPAAPQTPTKEQQQGALKKNAEGASPSSVRTGG